MLTEHDGPLELEPPVPTPPPLPRPPPEPPVPELPVPRAWQVPALPHSLVAPEHT